MSARSLQKQGSKMLVMLVLVIERCCSKYCGNKDALRAASLLLLLLLLLASAVLCCQVM